MRYPYFWSRKGDHWEDSWTYGDWRQYICKRGEGLTQCARVSRLPLLTGGLGFIISAGTAMLMLTARPELLDWRNAYIQLGLSTAAWVIPAIFSLSGRTLMKAVGPLNRNGYRTYPGEEG